MADEQRSRSGCGGFALCKLLVIIYAFLFLVIGIVLLVVSAYVESVRKRYEDVYDAVSSASILAIFVSIFIILFAIIGLIGAARERLVLLRVFLGVIIVIFLLQVIIGILAFVYREQATEIASEEIEFALQEYHSNEDIAHVVDAVQRKYECCGLKEGPVDWQKNANYSCSADSTTACSVPDSCCGDKKDCGLGVRKNPSTYRRKGVARHGCTVYFLSWVESHIDLVGATALGLAIPQIIGIFMIYIYIQKVEDRKYLFTYRERLHNTEKS